MSEIGEPALKSFSVRNFRSLARVDVDLGPLNVLVGPNAAGKSNLLDVLGFLGDAARTDLLPALAKRGGYERLRFRGGKRSPSKVEVKLTAILTKFASANAPDEYAMEFRVHGATVVREESFQFKRTQGRGRRITVSGTRVEVDDERAGTREATLDASVLGLATLKRLGPDTGRDQVIELTDALESFRVFEVDVAAARQPAGRQRGAPLAPDASNLSTFLADLAESDADLWEEFMSDARAVVPGLVDIEFVALGGADEGVFIELRESGLRGRTVLAEASFGTIRGLALLALLYDPAPPRITCIEEIDHGLHPYALDRIVALLRSASQRTQFLIATHSPVLVNRLSADELIVCERDSRTGASRIPAINPQDVRTMADAGELELGELWFSGSLGGVPA
ncbi:MAG: AAA family ATPase [Solirubrobacteraceae bacterium MAG38_C4-C5]|nr:AAA family ATPase [Candidatus Siliceabacter maunaloa]